MASQNHKVEDVPRQVRGNGNTCWVDSGSSTSVLGGIRFSQRLGESRWTATRVTGVPLGRSPVDAPVDEREASDTPSLETVYLTSVSCRVSNVNQF